MWGKVQREQHLREEREEFLATDCTDGHKGKAKERKKKRREDLREDTDKKKERVVREERREKTAWVGFLFLASLRWVMIYRHALIERLVPLLDSEPARE